jgi:cell wall-associated NlpC family hydrolase
MPKRFVAIIIFLGCAAGAAAGWFDQPDWLAAVTYRQAEDAIYFDTTGALPPQVESVPGVEPELIVFDLDNLRVNPRVYTLAPRDGVVENIRLESVKEGGQCHVEVVVSLAKPFEYAIERRQVENGVSQVILRLKGVDVKRVSPDAGGKAALYARPSADTEIVAFAPFHSKVEVYDFAKGMYLVKTPEGALGWVRASNLKIEGENPFAAPKEIPPGAGIRDKIVATAEKYLGVPYVWGGTSAKGFDCSGLVQTVFAENGVQLPRGSGDQFREGRKISRKNLRPGDLVFFHTYTSGPSHVGIYVGDGKFLHAESSPRGVTITPLSEPYWDERFHGARTWVPE